MTVPPRRRNIPSHLLYSYKRSRSIVYCPENLPSAAASDGLMKRVPAYMVSLLLCTANCTGIAVTVHCKLHCTALHCKLGYNRATEPTIGKHLVNDKQQNSTICLTLLFTLRF